MTTPGGVPNLPQGALTIDTLAPKTQDMSPAAMKSRAAERISSIFDGSTGANPSSDLTPFGILTSLFAGFNSTVANADPADVQGPDDLPGLLLQFIEGLPIVSQFIGLFDAIIGTYTGTDTTLLSIQEIFAPIRAVLQLLTNEILPMLDGLNGWITETIVNAERFKDLVIAGFSGQPVTDVDWEAAFPLLTTIRLQIEAAVAAVQDLENRVTQYLQELLGNSTGQSGDVSQLFDNWVAGISSWWTSTVTSLGPHNPIAVDQDGEIENLRAIVNNLTGTTTQNTWIDNFDRTSLGAAWTVISGTPDLSSGDFFRSPDKSKIVYNAHVFNTARHYVQARLRHVGSGQARLIIMSDTTAANYAGIEIQTGTLLFDYLVIISCTAGVVTSRTLFPFVPQWQTNDIIGVGYDPSTSKYVAFYNNQPMLEWQDSTPVVGTGSTHRSQAIESNISLFPAGNPPGLDNIRAYDW